jgi:hypothetical protein
LPAAQFPLIAPLFEGPIDIVGDIHGEIDALRHLTSHLGYDSRGGHPDGRHLVFVGDLCDRGADSPAVVGFVSALIERGLAQCVLGNHELNLLRQSRKEGNGWYFAENHDMDENKFADSKPLPAADRAGVEAFLSRLPLALERNDLRLVHAAWHQPSIDTARSCRSSALQLYDAYAASTQRHAAESGLAARAAAEVAQYAGRLKDKTAHVPLLPDSALLDEKVQTGNPVRIITSGIERVARAPFFASGRWRMVNRVAWWNDYTDATAVIFGHYWRWPTSNARRLHSRGEPDLFIPAESHHLLGPRRNAFCVDFAVGGRYKERALNPSGPSELRLAAVRWPEAQAVFDNGHGVKLV